uniref:Uncharacterized protein n=1 Tax=Astatotilapia calliptera TaxID=8154 RepID=A0AAX7TCP8_ASTCA
GLLTAASCGRIETVLLEPQIRCAASCPLVEGLYLQEADSMLQLLCAPSQHRTDILLCTESTRCFCCLTLTVVVYVQADMAVLGQELLLCRASDVDLIRVRVCIQLVMLLIHTYRHAVSQ